MPYEEVWYAIEASFKDADDWFANTSATYDSIESARNQTIHKVAGFDYRIVRKTLRTEVVK